MLYYLKPPRVTFDGSDLVEKCVYRNLHEPSVQDLSAVLILIQYHLCKGSYEFKRGDRETALDHLRTAAQLGHGMKETLHAIGVLMFNHGLQNEAIAHCEEAARIDPRWAVPRWSLFRIYKIQSRWEEVRGQLLLIIEADPDDSRACAEMGFLLHNHFDDSPGAVRSWREALRRNPALSRIKRILDRYDQEGRLPERG
jgi:tetratricopeptide (TPR) repeat protein